MATNIKLKKSSVAGKIPLSGDLDYGELAINYADGKLYYKNSLNEIKSFIDSDGVKQLIFAAGLSGSEGRALLTDYSYLADSGQTDFTGVDEQGDTLQYNGENLLVHLNGVLLVNGIDYTAEDGTTVSLSQAADSGDIIAITAIYGDSVYVPSIVDSAYVQSRQITYDVLDSAQILSLIATVGYLTTAIDSNEVLNLIDSAYINSRVDASTDSSTVINLISSTVDSSYVQNLQDFSYNSLTDTPVLFQGNYDSLSGTPNVLDSAQIIQAIVDDGFTKYDSTDTISILSSQNYATQTYVNNAIDSIVGAAPGALNTLQELAEALNNDSDAYNTLLGQIGTKIDSSGVVGLIDSAYIQARVTIPDAGTDSATVINLVTETVDSAYIQARQADIFRDSGFVTDIIDSAYVAARSPGGTDSATVETIINNIVDSAYVRLHQYSENGISSVSQYNFSADSGQTDFTGVSFISQDNLQVFLNGILLKPVSDYVTVSNNQVSLVEAADSGDELRIIAFETYSQRVSVDDYIYSADSGQTQFTGVDDNNNTLTYTPGNVQVHLNGLLLASGLDYTATSGSTVTLVSEASAGDTVIVTAISGDSSYVTKMIESYVDTTILSTIDSAYVNARVTIPDAGVDSASVINIITNEGFSKYDSANTLGLVDSAYVQARVTLDGTGLDSAQVIQTIETAGYTTYDSENTLGLIDSTYIQSRQITYSNVSEFTNDVGYTTYDSNNTTGMLAGYATESFVGTSIDSAVNALIDGAPGALDTLNELAAALNDDSQAYNTLLGQIAALPDSAEVASIVTSYGYTTYDSTDASSQIDDYVTSTFDSFFNAALANKSTTDLAEGDNLYYTTNRHDSDTLSLVDSAYVQARVTLDGVGLDSAAVLQAVADDNFTKYDSTDTIGILAAQNYATQSYVTSTVDSAYIQARQIPQDFAYSSLTGAPNVLDSATIFALIDSAYVAARAPAATGEGGVTFVSYDFTADSGQTVFTGADDTGDTLKFSQGQIQVYRNGILLIDSSDYSTNASGTEVTLVRACSTDDIVTIASFTATAGLSIGAYDYFADSGQSIFSGVDIDGNTLSYSPGNILVHVNGLLLTDSDDYIATNGTSITIPGGLDSGDVINIVAFKDTAVNYIDSAAVIGLIDSAYIQARQVDITIDSAAVIGLIDSAYIQARQVDIFRDSAFISNIIDSNLASLQTSIIPAVDDAIDLGSPTKRFRDLYLGPGSLYINNKKVIEDNAGTIRVRTDSDQNLSIRTFGTGQTTLQSETGINITSTNSGDITFTTSSGNVEFNGDISINATKSINSSNANPINFGDAIDLNSNRIINIGEPVDSTDAANKSYVLTRISTSLASYATEAYVQSAIDSIVGAAPGALDTLNELAAALGDDANFSTTVTNLIATKIDSAQALAAVAEVGYITSTFDSAAVIQIIADDNFTKYDSTDTLGILSAQNYATQSYVTSTIDSAYINARVDAVSGTDSSTVVSLITSTVDSAYIQARQSAAEAAGVDSSAILSLVDSDYVAARSPLATVGAVSVRNYRYSADSGQTIFSGSDIFGNTLSYVEDRIQVFINGVLLLDSSDYTASNGNQVILTTGADLNDNVVIAAYEGGYNESLETQLTSYEFIADSGQTVFTGTDRDGNSLSYSSGQVLVFLNGTLLVDGNDYAATSGSSIVFTEGVDSGDFVNVVKVGVTGVVTLENGDVQAKIESTVDSSYIQAKQNYTTITTFEFIADSGQTTFTGADAAGSTLEYTPGNLLVHLNGILLKDSADYNGSNGQSIVLTTSADSNDILAITSFGNLSFTTATWSETSTNITASSGRKYIVDCSESAITLTLPSSPSFGDEVKVIDGTGSAGTNNITINRNGNKILGADSDFTLDINRSAVDFVYYNAAQGWIISGNT